MTKKPKPTPKRKDLGSYLWRGGKRIDIEKEEDVFTAKVESEAELNSLCSLPGVKEVRPLQAKQYRVYVEKGRRDKAMADYRSKDISGIAHHAYRPQDAANTRYYLTDQIVVKFRPEASKESIESILSDAGVRVLKEYPGEERTVLVQVMKDADMNPIKVANKLAMLDDVEYAEPNLVNRFQTFYRPRDSLFERQWHLSSWDGLELSPDADVSAPEAWDIERGKREIVVAVVDDGFDLDHPDFMGEGKVVFPKDYVDGDSSPFPTSEMEDYHGTPCAGVAIAEENGSGVVGIAPGCAFMPVRFPFSADDNFLWEIFDFVGKHADVISCSWGPPPAYAPLSQLLIDRFTELTTSGGPRKKGCVIVFATGNYNSPLNDPDNVSFRWLHPVYGLIDTYGPIFNGNTCHPGVIAVSSSTSQNRKAAYSNWGPEVWVCAPSNNFHPIDDQMRVPGQGVWTTDNERHGLGFSERSQFTGDFGGTSSAAPLVAGICALILSANNNLTAAQVKEILKETADKIVDDRPDIVLGKLGGTYDATGRCNWFGFGKVNAARAVRRAKELLGEQTGISEMSIGAEVTGRLDKSGDAKVFKVKVGDGLNVMLQGAKGQDFDIFIRKDAPPTTKEYDAQGIAASPNENVSLGPVQPGDYYIMVRSYRGSGDFSLKLKLT